MEIKVHRWEPIFSSIPDFCCIGLQRFWHLKTDLDKTGLYVFIPKSMRTVFTYGCNEYRTKMEWTKIETPFKFCPFCGEEITIIEEEYKSLVKKV